MSEIKHWYASAPTDRYDIATVEVQIPGHEPLRYCNGYEDRWLGVEGVPRLFEASPLSVALPKKDTSGQQTLVFGFAGVNGKAQRAVDDALATRQPIVMIYRLYLSTDLMTPAERPHVMTVVGGTFEEPNVTFEGSYYDLLNSVWQRDYYTVESAPGVKWM